MRYRDFAYPHAELHRPQLYRPRDPLPNETSLTVHIEDEQALEALLAGRHDAEIVERDVSVMPNSSLVYVRCDDEEVAETIWEAWLPYHPSERRRRKLGL